jgi:predicted amidohydrolase
LKVAALQHDIVWEHPQANFERLAPRIAEAAAAGARLVALTEMFSCGFSMESDRIAEPTDGPSERFLREQARRHGVWLAASVPQRPAGAERPFNTLLVVSPEGTSTAYRKRHPFSFGGEDRHYASGDEIVTLDVEGLRLTPFICYDLRFADDFWSAAERTDAYLVVANWPSSRRLHWQALLLARAIENQAWVIGVNRVGRGGALEYSGDSRIVDPWGEETVAAEAVETMLLVDVDPGRAREARERFPVLRDRR